MTHEQKVKVKFPDASIVQCRDPMPYHAYLVRSGTGSGFHLGGGPTEEEAWRNAAIHTDHPIYGGGPP